MIETMANGYSYESTQRELSNEYQHDRVQMIFKNLCVLVPWMKVASALEGLRCAFKCCDILLISIDGSPFDVIDGLSYFFTARTFYHKSGSFFTIYQSPSFMIHQGPSLSIYQNPSMPYMRVLPDLLLHYMDNTLMGNFNPFTLRAAETGLTVFVLLFEQKAYLEKYLMEKC